MFKFFKDTAKKLFGTKYDKDVAKYLPYVEKINEEFEALQPLSNDELRQKTHTFRATIAEGLKDINEELNKLEEEVVQADLDDKEAIFQQIDELKEQRDEALEVILWDILPEAFAVVKETARRFSSNATLEVTATEHDMNMAANKDYILIDNGKAIWKNQWKAAGGDITWNMVHYDVQLIGGMVLHDGKIAEMQTGEGKTLVATLPAYLNGLTGLGVQVITVNNYLALRDCEWIGPIFEFLFLTTDCVDKYQPHSDQRKKAYKNDIIYGTNNEFGFDYLRDNMVRSNQEKVQQKHHFAMIDEVDSVLIDDARTPLIISGPVPEGNDIQEYKALRPSVENLIAEQRKLTTKYLSEATKHFKAGNFGHEEGQFGLALLRTFRSLPRYRPLIKFLSEEGVKVALQKTEGHYMQENSKHMHLVDEPLLFTIDEKNKQVSLTERGAEFLSKGSNDEGLFVLPDIASEIMAIDSDEELDATAKIAAKGKVYQDFSIKTQRLHSVNQLLKAYTLFEKDTEYLVMDGEVKIVDEQTGRMMEGRRYSDGLHQALEAKEGVEIGKITQTYATITLQNYFRMYHKLAGMTGTAETEAGELWEIYKLDVVVIPTNKPIAREDKDDLVFKTNREKLNAVIEEIGRLSAAKRPVLVGTTSVDISEKLSRMLQLKNIEHNVLNAKQHKREADIVSNAGLPGQVTIATNMAGRGTDIKLSKEVIEAGGLAIIGTERHESRRVDRQLRGRAGRQGDPGSSGFYVSLEDDLMRKFGSDKLASLMDKMGHQEGEVLQHSMVSKSIERAQKKVEENYFGVRKRLLEYDDVMNIQREAIYKKRNNALSGERFKVDIRQMIESLLAVLVSETKGLSEGYKIFKEETIQVLGMVPSFDEAFFVNSSEEVVTEEFQKEFDQFYQNKFDGMTEFLMKQINHVNETQPGIYKRIAIPFSDGRTNPLPISADIQKSIESDGKNIQTDIEQAVVLAIIDDEWKDHLRTMDELKETSNAASFQQKDPLVIYKLEAFKLFEQLVYTINEKVSSYLSKGKLHINIENPEEVQEARAKKSDLSKLQQSRGTETQEAAQRAAQSAGREAVERKIETFKREQPKVGRNEPCPCGSGKKYKQCHGKK